MVSKEPWLGAHAPGVKVYTAMSSTKAANREEMVDWAPLDALTAVREKEPEGEGKGRDTRHTSEITGTHALGTLSGGHESWSCALECSRQPPVSLHACVLVPVACDVALLCPPPPIPITTPATLPYPCPAHQHFMPCHD